MTVAVADTSVLVAFSAIQRLDVLRAICSELLIPDAVQRELVEQGAGWKEAAGIQNVIESREWIRVETVTAIPVLPLTRRGLFSGEAEAIALAERHECPILLDDMRARRIASHRGLFVIGSLGLLILGKRQGIIPRIGSLIDEMQSHGIRFGGPLVRRARKEVGED
jgi:predicted nucleic acid-binding protein